MVVEDLDMNDSSRFKLSVVWRGYLVCLTCSCFYIIFRKHTIRRRDMLVFLGTSR